MMDRLPNWAIWSIMPAAAVLTPVLGFLTAVAAAVVVSALKEAGVPTLVALTAAGVSGFLLGRTPPVRWGNSLSLDRGRERASPQEQIPLMFSASPRQSLAWPARPGNALKPSERTQPAVGSGIVPLRSLPPR